MREVIRGSRSHSDAFVEDGQPTTTPTTPTVQSPSPLRRRSLSYEQRREAPVYYDSRAATKSEYRRRGATLQDYYDQNPHLLPQLPFTWHHGWKRWRLGGLIFLIFVDGCVLPVVLY